LFRGIKIPLNPQQATGASETPLRRPPAGSIIAARFNYSGIVGIRHGTLPLRVLYVSYGSPFVAVMGGKVAGRVNIDE